MVDGGYYAITVVPALFAIAFISLSVYRLYALARNGKASIGSDSSLREIQKNWAFITVFLTVYSVLVAVECVDPRGVFGLYSDVTGYILRFLMTEVLILATLTLMHAFLLTGLAIRQQPVHWSMKPSFVVAAVVKFGVGIGTIIVFSLSLQKSSIVVNDWTLFACFIVALCLFLCFLLSIIAVLYGHMKNLAKMSSDTTYLRRALLRFVTIFVLTAICLCCVPPFLALNAIKHSHDTEAEVGNSDPNHFTFEYSVWFKLAWACFLFWMVPASKPRVQAGAEMPPSVERVSSHRSGSHKPGSSTAQRSLSDEL